MAFPQAPPAKTDYRDESFVIEQLKDEVAFNEDGTGQEDQTARVRIQTEAGVQRFGVLSFSYRNERDRLEILQIRVHKPDGTIVDTPESNVQDLPADVTREAPTYSDLHEKQAPVKALGMGDILEWHTRTVHLKADAAGQFWYSRDFVKDVIVLEQTLQITVPAGKYVKVSSPDTRPEVREAGGHKTYSWKTSQLNHPKEEDNEKKIQPRVRPRPAVQLTTFRSWEELGRWYAELQKPKLEVTPAIQAKAAELTANLKTDADKERALYQFVASKFRYISISFGDGWYQPHSAAEVLANQYGDCKDKHTLLATLLKAAGIEAWPALIGAGNTVDPDVPSPAQFNHVITYLPQANGGTFVDSTPEIAPFGMLSTSVREQHALIIPDQGVPALKDTPDGSLFPNEETLNIQSKLNTEGTLTGDFEIVLRGDDELVLRSVFHSTAPKDWTTLTQKLSQGMGYAGTVRNLEVGSPMDTSGPFRFAYKYERKNYSDWENRRITPPVPPLSFLYSGEEEKPSQPLDLNRGKFTHRATVALPDGYSAEIPADVRLDTGFGSYTASYTVDKGVLSAERVLTVKKTKLAVNEWEAYGKFVKTVVEDETHFIQLVRSNGETSSKVVRDDPKATGLLQKAAEALQRRDLSAAREALAQAERINPQQTGLWAVYGGLYGMQGQNQKAIDALQKEIQFHPGNEAMYQVLAEAQNQAGQKEAAIATLNKLVKMAPDNSQGAAALASLLIAEKKYNEAVAPLEGALKANPHETRLEIALMEAQLQQGKKAEGLATLAKLREHASEPADLNSAAYVLADTNTEPDVARELSEKAAAGFAEQTKDVTLTNVTSEHFQLIGTLGATWDTVGWAYFRAGDLAKAETYVNAAWVLIQHPVAADHLGQIYERQGKKAEAIHAYQLSLAANHDQPDTRKRLENLGGPEEEPPVTLRRGKPTGSPRASLEDELSQMRTIRFPELPTRMASADFFLLFSPAGVQDVRFIRGDEALKTAAATLKKARYPVVFPDQGLERIVRRGILSCSNYTTPSCTFVLLLPANTTTN